MVAPSCPTQTGASDAANIGSASRSGAPGASVRAGDRYGVMKFGSRMDIFLPVTAQIVVAVGDTVRGGETIIAVLH